MTTAQRLYILVCTAGFLLGGVGVGIEATRQVQNPQEFDFGEGVVMWQAQHMLDPQKVYRSIDTPPFIVTHYPPVYHFAVRLAKPWTNSLLQAGRLVSVLAAATTLLAILLSVYLVLPSAAPLEVRLMAALTAAALPIATKTFEWLTYARVDSLALSWTFVGFLVFLVAGRTRWGATLAVLLFAIAVYTKQTMLAAPAACLTILLVLDRRALLVAGSIGLLAGASALLYLQQITQGGFLQNIVGYNINPFSLQRAVRLASRVLPDLLPMIALGGGLLLGGRWYKRIADRWRSTRRRRAEGVTAAYLLAAAPLLVLAGKQGSSINYFLEFLLILALLSGFAMYRLLMLWPCRPNAPYLSALLVPLAVSVLFVLPLFRLAIPSFSENPNGLPSPTHAALVERLRATPGPVYGDPMVAILEAGHDLVAEPAIVKVLSGLPIWDETAFVRMFQQRQFRLIALQSPERGRVSAAVKRAIESNYTLTEVIGRYNLYRPRA